MIDFKRDPYFDDFDQSKNFTSVLFKAGYPVQVRELNQIQSIQHNQLERFAEHIFKHGSMVEGRGITLTDAPYITIQTNSPTNNLPVDLNIIETGSRLYGDTTKVEATVIHVDSGDGIIAIYLNYIKSGSGNFSTFEPGETVFLVDDRNNIMETMKVRCPECGDGDSFDFPVKGKGSLWTIPDAVYFVNGYFVTHENSVILGEKYYTNNSIYEVGFRVEHRVVDSDEDPTLFDNTLGYPNYGAPGADRARLSLIPTIRHNSDDDPDFITLAKMVNGTATYLKTKPEYSAIMDMIAERTYDESGNYTVVPFKISLRDHLNRRGNGGLYSLAQGGDDGLFVATISPGKAYIRGYQLETISETPVTMEKARDTKSFRSFYTQFTGLSYILIRPTEGSFPIANDIALDSIYGNLTVDLHDGPTSGGIATGNVIGYLKPYDVEIHELGPNPIYKLYFTEMKMNEGKSFVQVQSMKRDGTIFFNASTVEDELTERPKIFNNNETALIWKIRDSIKTLMDADNNDIRSLSYTGREKFTAVLDGAGTYTWNANKGEYYLPFNPLTTIAAFVSNQGVAERVHLTTQVTATSDRLSVNFESSNGGKRVVLLHTVMKSGSVEKKKSIVRRTDTGREIDSNGVVSLTRSDIYNVISVKRYSKNNPDTKVNVDLKSIVIDNGQRDFAYVPGSFKLNEIPANPSTIAYEILYEYFEHSAGDFFSIDSYTDLLKNPENEFFRSDIPVYKSKGGSEYRLTDCLDFRPLVLDNNPVKIEQPMLNGQVITDLEVYLPRIDLVVADRYGSIRQKRGESKENPSPPKVAPDGSEMALYEIHQQPYVLNLESGVRVKFVENKRYTMRDIGRLEQRIKNVEYYTTFSLMELDLEQTSVKDEFGFDRFKNGFMADNFSNFQGSNPLDPEFRAAMDRNDKTLRPEFRIFESGLEFSESGSTNFRRHGNIVMIDYNEEEFITQPYCSKHLSVNPYFIFNKEGKVVLDPAFDNWVDLNHTPKVNIDVGVPPVETDRPVGQNWGSWTNANRASAELGEYATDITLKPYMRSVVVKFYATGMKKNTRLYCFFDNVDVTSHCRPLVNGSTYGDPISTDDSGNASGEFRIPDATFFAGQKEFILTNDTANADDPDLLFTRAEGVFWSGGIDLTKQASTLNVMTPLVAKPPTTPPAPPAPPPAPTIIVPPTPAPVQTPAPLPTPSVTSSGTVPQTTTTRPTTTRSTTTRPTTTRPTTTRQTTAVTRAPVPTSAPAQPSCYTALWEILQDFNIPDIWHSASRTYNPTPANNQIAEECRVQTGFTGHGAPEALTISMVNCLARRHGRTVSGNIRVCNGAIVDPVAQSFIVGNDCFITSTDIFFHTVASDDLIFVWVVDMLNGYPTRNILGEITMHPHECFPSSDGSIPTNVRFPVPVFVEAGKEYAIVVGGRNPDSRVWISKLGERDLGTDTTIDTQPTLGTLFKSQNASTWTASQYEDLKFTLYRARFKHREATMTLVNKQFRDDTTELNPFETQSGSRMVRVRCDNHGMSVGDRIRFALGEKTQINLLVTSGELSIGQRIVTDSGSGTIHNITNEGSLKKVELRSIRGRFLFDQPFVANPVTIEHPTDLLNSSIRIPLSNTPSLEARGRIRTTFNPMMNGIPFSDLNSELVVEAVDSTESFVVRTNQASTMTGFTGGSVILNPNKRYDGFNISGSYLPNGSQESWEFRGVGHGMNEEFEFDDYRIMPPIAFEPQTDVLLNQPYKLVNRENTIFRMSGVRSLNIYATFSTPDDLVSPVMNVDTFSFIGISNVVDWNQPSTFNIAPNAANRLKPETNPTNGDALFKYVTREIHLAEPALDLRILLDVHKNEMNDFDLYVKVRAPEDSQGMELIPWRKVENVWKDFICSSRDEYREVDCSLGELMPGVFDGIMSFDTFRVKIVGKSKNTSMPPLFKMLRVIAVT